MKVHLGVDSDSGLIHSMETTAANVHDLTPAAELLHGEETVVYGVHVKGIEKRPEMQGRGIGFRVAMRPGTRVASPRLSWAMKKTLQKLIGFTPFSAWVAP